MIGLVLYLFILLVEDILLLLLLLVSVVVYDGVVRGHIFSGRFGVTCNFG